MKWKNEYATGIQRIDDQHKTLFKMANDFRNTLNHGGGEYIYSTLLGFLHTYCQNHFNVEERCMEKYNCPTAQQNIDAHANFMKILNQYQEIYDLHGYQESDALRLVDTIDQWLDQHICGIDSHLKNCLNKNPSKTPSP